MKKYQFNKLVRSKIPNRMKKEGVEINSTKLSKDDFILELKNKILEEAKEVHDTESREELIIELADVIEVVHTIAKSNKINLAEIEAAQIEKKKINGEFLSKNYINYIEVAQNNKTVIEYLENKNRPYKLKI